MSNTVILLLFFALSAGALLAAWAGIRSIQAARSVVFYRTRRAKMVAGWQWLAGASVLAFFAIGSLFFRDFTTGQIFSPTPISTETAAWTLTPASISSLTFTPPSGQTPTHSVSVTPSRVSTETALATPTRTPAYLGTYTAFAVWTERRSTFIAALSSTPTPSRTPIPTWTRTPSSTPRPTYTPSLTRTPRTPPPTWTSSLTSTLRPTNTRTATSTRTPTPTRTVTPTP